MYEPMKGPQFKRSHCIPILIFFKKRSKYPITRMSPDDYA